MVNGHRDGPDSVPSVTSAAGEADDSFTALLIRFVEKRVLSSTSRCSSSSSSSMWCHTSENGHLRPACERLKPDAVDEQPLSPHDREQHASVFSIRMPDV